MADFDLIVVGGGMGGLALAGLAQRSGLRTALLEAHTRLGGCAGWFDRGPYTFDAGATALMGLNRGQPIGDLLAAVGFDDFQAAPTPAYRVHLPDRTLDIVPNPAAFEAHIAAAFPGRDDARRHFWQLQAAVGSTLFHAASRHPRLPLRNLADALHDLKILGPRGLAAAATSLLTVDDVLRFFQLHDDQPFRSLVAMLLQDTAQAGPETVPFANAAACLHAYRLGMSRPVGGMRALAEGLGRHFANLGGDLRTKTLVDKVEPAADHQHDNGHDTPSRWIVHTRRHRERLTARHVAFNLPIDLAAKLLGRALDAPTNHRLAHREQKSRPAWSAFTGYLAFPRDTIDDHAPLFHQVLRDYNAPIHDGNNVLISLSPPCTSPLPPGESQGEGLQLTDHFRTATLSTHVRPADWANLSSTEYALKKATYRKRMLDALDQALPNVRPRLLHSEFATPRTFRRFTRRTAGAVGGAPVSRSNSNFLAVPCDALGDHLWLVGDSVFPGQGTMAVVLSAYRVLERITEPQGEKLSIPQVAKVWRSHERSSPTSP